MFYRPLAAAAAAIIVMIMIIPISTVIYLFTADSNVLALCVRRIASCA